jgi:hypothetical protein
VYGDEGPHTIGRPVVALGTPAIRLYKVQSNTSERQPHMGRSDEWGPKSDRNRARARIARLKESVWIALVILLVVGAAILTGR